MNKRSIIITTVLLLAYFVFTSGIVYEAMGSEVTNSLVVPYSISLSGERTGLVGIFTKDDQKCAEWVSTRNIPVVCDSNAALLLRSYDFIDVEQLVYFSGVFNNDRHYLFLTTWDIETGKIVSSSPSAGMRGVEKLPEIDNRYTEVFRSGKAVIYEHDFYSYPKL